MRDLAHPQPEVSIEAVVGSELTPARLAWKRFRRHRLAMVALGVLVLLTLLAIFAPALTPYGPTAQDLSETFARPSLKHLMGTDALGRDQLTRILYGGRVSLTIGLLSMVLAVLVGVVVGSLAGFWGGRVDTLLMRFTDLALSFPDIFLLILLAAIFGRSFATMVAVIGLLRWMTVARLVRGTFLSLRELEFVQAARAAGAPPLLLIRRHLLPNALGPIIVAATLGTASAIVTESTLSFLGLGLQPPASSWGTMLRTAQQEIWTAPWTAIFPGLMIFLTVISINFVGDGLRDALDPRRTKV